MRETVTGTAGDPPGSFRQEAPGPAEGIQPVPSVVTWSLPCPCSTASRMESARSDLQTSGGICRAGGLLFGTLRTAGPEAKVPFSIQKLSPSLRVYLDPR